VRKILVAFLIVAFTLPLSALVVAAQPSDASPGLLELSDVKLWTDSAPLPGGGSSLGSGPDLTLSPSDITFDPSAPTTADTITISATIHNVGDVWAVGVVVQFLGGGGVIGDKTINRIKYGKSATASIEWGPVAAGVHTVNVVVDPDKSISESNETNNAASNDVTVTEAGAPPPPPPPGDKWAVVIGISDYEGTANDLWNPANDAVEMEEALIKYGFPKDNIKTLLDSQAKAQAIVDAIDWLAGVEDAGDTVVFFFSGHGYRVSDRQGWDNDLEGDRYDECIVSYDLYAITDGYLKQKFSAFETQKFALIFGSCYSGGMFDDNDDLQAPGRVICSACKADQYGWDYLLLGNTLFGYYFVDEAILQGLAEGLHVSGDGVSMEEALDYAYPRVTAEQRRSQPQIWDGSDGEFIP
jgi:hypothetical protein